MFLKRLVIGLLWQLIEMYLFKEITLNKVILAKLILVIFIILKLRAVSAKKNAKLIKRGFWQWTLKKKCLSAPWAGASVPARRDVRGLVQALPRGAAPQMDQLPHGEGLQYLVFSVFVFAAEMDQPHPMWWIWQIPWRWNLQAGSCRRARNFTSDIKDSEIYTELLCQVIMSLPFLSFS